MHIIQIFAICALYGIVMSRQVIILAKEAPKYAEIVLNHRLTHLAIENSLEDYYQVEYYIPLQFGSEKKTYEVVIDTGSSDLWLPSVGAHGFKELKNSQFYDCSKSTTCDETDEQLDIDYDDGPISGYISSDQVCLDGCQYLIKKQYFLLVDQASGNMKNSQGILGLSFAKLAANPHPTLLQNLVSNKFISTNLFSLYLTDKGSSGSKLIFGGVDNSLKQNANQDFVYSKIISNHAYYIELEGIQVNGKLFKAPKALIDSGTSCFTIQADLIDKIKSNFEESKELSCQFHVEKYAPAYSLMSCKMKGVATQDDILKVFPNVQIYITDSQILELSPLDYIMRCKVENKETNCMTKLERSTQDSFVILGDAFLQSFYTVFDQDKMQIGFVHSINNGALEIKDSNSRVLEQTYSQSGLIIVNMIILLIAIL